MGPLKEVPGFGGDLVMLTYSFEVTVGSVVSIHRINYCRNELTGAVEGESFKKYQTKRSKQTIIYGW